ncbi:MAG: restriction endonuclease subunit S [Candidatus Roizmanbacteria bacterium]
MSQISHIKLKDIREARRYDAEYFKPEYLEIERKLNRENKNLKDFDVKIYHPNEIKREYVQENGVLFVRTQNVRPLKFDLTNEVYISKNDASRLKKNKISNNDILMSRTGANFGQTCLFNEGIEAIASSHTFIIKSGKINPFFLSIFFNTELGRKMIDKGMYGGLQPEITPTHLLKIPFLNFPQSFQLQIEQIVKSAHAKQTKSKQLYREAEELLLRELGLLNYEIKRVIWFTTTKKEVEKACRFDSEYFQPKYADIIKKIEKYEGGWDTIKNIAHFKDKNYNPKGDQTYKYLALSNISNNGYVQDYQREIGKNLPSRARRQINTGDVVISSIEGSLSSCSIIDQEFDNAICSTGFFVLNSKIINSETLLIIFKSKIIQELLQKGSKGTILTAISKTELESIKIPLLKPSIQIQIAEKIQESHRLRKESKDLLEEAKRKVEEEIEKQ